MSESILKCKNKMLKDNTLNNNNDKIYHRLILTLLPMYFLVWFVSDKKENQSCAYQKLVIDV